MENDDASACELFEQNGKPRLEEVRGALIGKEQEWPDYKTQTNVREWGYLIQVELLESLRSTREKVGNKIREQLWGCTGGNMQECRAEFNRKMNPLRRKVKELMQSAKSRIDQEIDTDEDWEHAGKVPEWVIKIRCHIAQDEIDKATRGHPHYPNFGGGLFPTVSKMMGICAQRNPREAARKSTTSRKRNLQMRSLPCGSLQTLEKGRAAFV